MAELASEDQEGFRNFQRIDHKIFQELLTRVGPRIEKQDTFMRKALSAGLRLAITLRFLATGDSYKSLEYNFRVAKNSICHIVPETCEAIIAELAPEVCCCPSTPAEWMSVSKGFSERWNFHNTIGALDGKHIAIKCPAKINIHLNLLTGAHRIVLLGLLFDQPRLLHSVLVGFHSSVIKAFMIPVPFCYFYFLLFSECVRVNLFLSPLGGGRLLCCFLPPPQGAS